MIKEITGSIKVAGLSIVTTNEAAMNKNSIGKLWEEFSKTPVKDQLGKVTSASVFAVYSEYENGYQGKYRITVGYAVNDDNPVPAGLVSVNIPAAAYKAYPSKSHAPADIVETWKTIWQKDPETFPRSFVTDFEEYSENGVMIHIGYK